MLHFIIEQRPFEDVMKCILCPNSVIDYIQSLHFLQFRAMDKVLGEIPVAFVVRRDGSTLTEAAVIDYIAQRVSFD